MIILFQLVLHVLEWTSTQYGISEMDMDLNHQGPQPAMTLATKDLNL
jgi:hypothetical protein